MAATNNDSLSWRVKATAKGVLLQSRVLGGVPGFCEAFDVLREMQTLGPRIAGNLAVRIAWQPVSMTVLRQAMRIVALFEPALLTLAAPVHALSGGRVSTRIALRGTDSFDDSGWFAHVRSLPRGLSYLSPHPLWCWDLIGPSGDEVVDFTWPCIDLDAATIISYVSLSQHILRAADELRPLPVSPDRRLHSAPICRGARGDVASMTRYLGASAPLRDQLLGVRARALGVWQRHPTFAPLVRRLTPYWASRAA
jgi:hypothetical protein